MELTDSIFIAVCRTSSPEFKVNPDPGEGLVFQMVVSAMLTSVTVSLCNSSSHSKLLHPCINNPLLSPIAFF